MRIMELLVVLGALGIKKIQQKKILCAYITAFRSGIFIVLTFGSVVGRETCGVTFLMGMPS